MQLNANHRGPDSRPQITKKKDGYMLTQSDGTTRYLDWCESVAWLLFKKKPNDYW